MRMSFFCCNFAAELKKEVVMSTIVFQPQDIAQMAFLTDFAKRVSVPYVIVPVNVRTLLSREEKRAQKRANSFAKLQEAFAGCGLTDEEIRQECEAVRARNIDEVVLSLISAYSLCVPSSPPPPPCNQRL